MRLFVLMDHVLKANLYVLLHKLVQLVILDVGIVVANLKSVNANNLKKINKYALLISL